MEIVTVAILGVATVASAWCAFQSSRWNDTETSFARDATDLRVEQSRLYAQATQTVAYDSTIAAGYASALADKNEQLQEFFRQSLIRPGFMPVIERWEAQAGDGSSSVATTSLFEDEDYLTGLFGNANEVDAQVTEASGNADEASSNGQDYLLTTLFMASALFFAGVVSSFRAPTARIMLLMAATLLLALGAARIVDLPIA